MVHLIFVCTYRMQLLIKYDTQINNHIYLGKQFWNERTFWGDGYFACSIGNVSKEIIEKYIQSQG
ncbi:transposase [Clostridium tagluense]|nr:transposase [Clostridium tagluense]MBU3128747.1 transposase [Clostridium tagluense]